MDVFLYYWEDEEAVECAYWMGAGVLKVQNECDGDHLVAFKRKQVVLPPLKFEHRYFKIAHS